MGWGHLVSKTHLVGGGCRKSTSKTSQLAGPACSMLDGMWCHFPALRANLVPASAPGWVGMGCAGSLGAGAGTGSGIWLPLPLHS